MQLHPLDYMRTTGRQSRIAVAGFTLGLLSGPCTLVLILVSNVVRDGFGQEKAADILQPIAVWAPGSIAIIVCGAAIAIILRSEKHTRRGLRLAVIGATAAAVWAVVPFAVALIAGFG
jgi:hypothetical protein